LRLDQWELRPSQGKLRIDRGELGIDPGELRLDQGKLRIDQRKLRLDQGKQDKAACTLETVETGQRFRTSDALAHRPDAAALWLQAAQGVNRLDWQIALTAQGLRSLLAARENPPDAQLSRLAAAVAEEELRLEISGGLLERAARQLALLPADVRAVIESGATGAVESLSGGINLQGALNGGSQLLDFVSPAEIRSATAAVPSSL